MDDPKDPTPEPEEPVTPAPPEEPEDPEVSEVEAVEDADAEPEARPVSKPAVDARTLLEQHVQKSKMQRKATVRAIVSLVVIGGLAFAGWKFVPQIVNSDPGTFASAGQLLAVRQAGEDSRVVMIGPGGDETGVPDYVAGSNDEYPTWGPDGQRVYFVSDRLGKEPHVYRWNPNPGKLLGLFARPSVERRSVDSRAKTKMSFEVPAGPDSQTALLIAGGTVLEFNPKDGETMQVLPPSRLKSASEGDTGEGAGKLDALYAQYGTGFLDAKWLPGKSFIVATMRTAEGGVMLLQQNMLDPKSPPQVFPFKGESLEFDVDPVTGEIVIAITACDYVSEEFIPKEAIVDNKVKKPFRHALLRLGTQGELNPFIASQDDKQCFTKPRISPQGLNTGLMAIIGPYDEQTKSQKPEILMLMGPIAQSETNTKGLARGRVYDAAWHPNGNKVAFTMYVPRNKKISLCSMNLDGTESKVLTGPDADYRYPSFSPIAQ